MSPAPAIKGCIEKIITSALVPFVIGVSCPSLRALTYVNSDYSAAENFRFSSGYLTSPVLNTSASFIGNGLDLSGVGWVDGSGVSGQKRMRNTTLLTPLNDLMALHYPASSGSILDFVGADGSLYSTSIRYTSTVSTGSTANDLLIGTLSKPFSASQGVTIYRVLETRDGSVSNLPMIIYGSNADNLGPRIGEAVGGSRTTGTTTQSWTSGGVSGNASFWDSGDSGSPSFVKYTAPDGTTSLTLVGAAYFSTGPSALQRSGIYNPVVGINATTKGNGYAVKWTIYDNAADSTHTAPQWNGAGDGISLSSAANWSLSSSPATLSVLFDASATPGSTNLTVDSALTLRGALFKASTSTQGFTISGTNTLTLASVGLRNESTATQTFNVPIALSDSQNWEAANGNLLINGNVDTTSGAHLLVVGGAHDTTLNGVISGAGALAKDDTGTLTLNAANTYSGKTWIHNGTLKLGTGSLPTGTEVIFQTTDPAVLDLNGRGQTIAGLKSNYGGTGSVQLSGGALTVNNASTNNYAGSIIGLGNFIKTGTGLLALTGVDTHTGSTSINGGVLRLGSASALSAGSYVILGGGVIELGAGDYMASLGTNAGQLRFTGNGGFSAYGGDRTVNLGGAGAALTWGQTNFVQSGSTLILSSTTSDSTVNLSNGLVLATSGTSSRAIQVDNGSAAVDARLSGDISAPGSTAGLTKSGSGTLELTGNNTYSGVTVITSGALRVSTASALSSASNLVLSGGVLELGAGDFTGSLGTGAGQVRFTSIGGFSAAGADRVVNIGGASTPQTLIWGETSNFLPSVNSLLLSSTGSDATVDFRNSINLGTSGSGTRNIQVDDGSAAVDARISGNISDSGTYSISKAGAGTLELTGNNNWNGSTYINGGALRVSSANALPSGNIALLGSVLELAYGNYTGSLGTGQGQIRFNGGGGGFSAVGADRIVNLGGTGEALTWATTNFIANGYSLYLSSKSADATVIFENGLILGTSGSGTRYFFVQDGAAAVDGRITGAITSPGGTYNLQKNGAGTLELSGANTYTGSTIITDGALRFANAAALPSTSNIVLSGGVLELSTGNLSASLGTGAGKISFSGNGGFSAAGANRTVTLNSGATLDWGETISQGTKLIFSSKSADATIIFTNPIRFDNTGASRTIIVNNGSASVDARLSGVISQVNENHGWTKEGLGTLELTGTNTYKGVTQVNAGTLLINGNQTSATGDVYVASGATLGGGGIIGGATYIDGTLALGDTADRLTFTKGLSFGVGASFDVRLSRGDDSTVAGVDYDQVAVTGTVDLNNVNLVLTLDSMFESTAQHGTVFILLASDGLLGDVAQGSATTVELNGLRYSFAISKASNDLLLTLNDISAVPEPARCAMLAGVLGMLAALTQRRRPPA